MYNEDKKFHFELPHTKILVLAAVCISMIAITIAYKVSEARKEVLKQKNISVSAGSDSETTAADRRVADALYEAQLGSLGNLASSSDPLAPSPKDTLTDRFSKDIFQAYIQFERSGEQLSETELSQNPIANIKTDFLPKPQYTSMDVTVFVPKTKDEIKQYGNLFAKTYLDALAPIGAHPEMFSDDLVNIGKVYRKTGEQLIKIKAPAEIAEKQLNLANGFVIMAQAFPLVNGQQKDPVKALLGLRTVKDSMENQITMFTEMSSYFKRNDILFEKGEPGALWNGISASSTLTN
jgi:hypothetical protein